MYAKLEDLNNLESLKGRLPEDKIKDLTYSRDEASVSVPTLGTVSIKVVERETPKCIKFEAVGSPIPANMWIQVIPDGPEASKMRVVVKADINFMFKAMIEKPLKEGCRGTIAHSVLTHRQERLHKPSPLKKTNAAMQRQ